MWHVCIHLLVLVPFLVLCLGENFLKYCYYDSLLFSRMREWFFIILDIFQFPPGLKVSCSLPTTCPMCKMYPTATCPMCKTYPTTTCPMCKTNPTMTRSASEMNPFNQNTVLLPVSCSVKISLPLVLIHVSNIVKFSANLVHFGLSSVQQIVHILSQRVSCCWLLLTGRLVPFLNLLVPLLSNVYTIFGSRIHINISFEIVSVDNWRVSTYTLLAVVYYADQHFTAQSSPVMGELGYYDGLALINPNVQCYDFEQLKQFLTVTFHKEIAFRAKV